MKSEGKIFVIRGEFWKGLEFILWFEKNQTQPTSLLYGSVTFFLLKWRSLVNIETCLFAFCNFYSLEFLKI